MIQSEPQFRIYMGWFAGLWCLWLWLFSVLLPEKRLWTSGWNPVLVVAHLVLHTIHFAQSCPTSLATFQLPPPAVNFVFNIETLSPVDHVSKHLFSFSHVAIAATQVTQKGLCLAVQRFCACKQGASHSRLRLNAVHASAEARLHQCFPQWWSTPARALDHEEHVQTWQPTVVTSLLSVSLGWVHFLESHLHISKSPWQSNRVLTEEIWIISTSSKNNMSMYNSCKQDLFQCQAIAIQGTFWQRLIWQHEAPIWTELFPGARVNAVNRFLRGLGLTLYASAVQLRRLMIPIQQLSHIWCNWHWIVFVCWHVKCTILYITNYNIAVSGPPTVIIMISMIYAIDGIHVLWTISILVSKTTNNKQKYCTLQIYRHGNAVFIHIVNCDSKKYGVPCQNPNFIYIYIYVSYNLCVRIACCIDSFNCLHATAKIKVSFSMAPHSQPVPTLTLSESGLHVHAKWRPLQQEKTPASSNMHQHAKDPLMLQMYLLYLAWFMPCSVVSGGLWTLNLFEYLCTTSSVTRHRRILWKQSGFNPKPYCIMTYTETATSCGNVYTTLLDTLTWRDGPHRLLKLLTGHLRHRSSRTGTQTSSNFCSVTRIPRGSSGSLGLSTRILL